MRQRVIYFLLLVGAGLVLYLSWVPVPKMSQIWFIPSWLASWADENRNDNIRTAVPLVALGLVAGAQLAWRHQPWGRWLLTWVQLVGLVSLAEAGQFFLAERSFDVGDIGWGAAGAAVGLWVVAGLYGGYRVVKKLGRAASAPDARTGY